MIRLFEEKDIPELQQLHQRFFEEHFQFPNLFDGKVLGSFVVTDEYGKIISFAGLKAIPEVISITDLSRSIPEKQDAYMRLIYTLEFLAKKYNFHQLNCFPQYGEAWERHLKKLGWKDLGKALYLEVD